MLYQPEDVKKIVEEFIQGAKVAVEDLTGSRDHYKIVVVTDAFAGKSLVQRHQMINEALKEPLKGPIHALMIEAYTNEQWKEKSGEQVLEQPKGIEL